MIQFLNPAWLWGLTGLLIPIGIHLLSRKEGKTIPIGSLRHFDESVTKQFRSIRLNEIGLLLLRCALITAVVLLLAGISFHSSNTKIRMAVVEPGVEKNTTALSVIDSLRTQGYSIHTLAPGFPEKATTDTLAISTYNNYWAALSDIQSLHADEVVILSYAYARNFKGRRLALPTNVRWLSFAPEPSPAYTAAAVVLPNDSLWIRSGTSTPRATVFQTQRIAATQQSNIGEPAARDTIAVAVVSGEGFEYDRNMILAALKTLQPVTPHVLAVTTHNAAGFTPQPSGWTIWLAATPPPAFKNAQNIVFSPCGTGDLPIILPGSEAALRCPAAESFGWVITTRLKQASVLKENMVLTLASLLLPVKTAAEATTHDKRVLPEQLLAASTTPQEAAGTKAGTDTTPHAPYWAILIFILLVAERWLAAKRNQ